MSKQNLDVSHLKDDAEALSARSSALGLSTQAIKFVIQVVSTGLLARFLMPEDYGLIAMTAVLTGFMTVIKDGGLSQATIQVESLNHAQISNLFWVNCCLGGVISILLFAIAPSVALFFEEPRLTNIIWFLTIPFLISGASVQHLALLQRQMRFSTILGLEVCSMAAGNLLAIYLAYAGYGYWALVVKVIAEAFITAVALWLLTGWNPGRPKKGAGVRALLVFGTDVLVFKVVNFFSRNADNLLIGWRWGSTDLGLYNRAYTLLMLPVGQVNAPISRVIISGMSRAKGDAAMLRRIYLGGLELSCALSLPLITIIVIFAHEIVRLWLGENWSQVAFLFQLLAPAAFVGLLLNTTGWVLISIGRVKRYRTIGVVSAPILVLGFAAGLEYGPNGVAIAYSIVMCLMLIPTWIWVFHKTEIHWFAPFRALIPVFTSTLAGAIAAIVMRSVTSFENFHSLFIGATLFLVVYATVYLLAFRKYETVRSLAQEHLFRSK